MNGIWRIHGSFPHADAMGVGIQCPLIISIGGDNIHLEEDFKNPEILVHAVCLT